MLDEDTSGLSEAELTAVWAKYTYEVLLPNMPVEGNNRLLAVLIGHIYSGFDCSEEDIAEITDMAIRVKPVIAESIMNALREHGIAQ